MVIAEHQDRGINNKLPGQASAWVISGNNHRIFGGGGEEAVDVLSQHFANQGINVSSFYGMAINKLPQRQDALPDNLSLRQITQSRHLSFRGFSPERFLAFHRLLETEKPDFIVVNMPAKIGLTAAAVLRNSSVPTVFWWHNSVLASYEGQSDYDREHPVGKVQALVGKSITSPLKKIAIRMAMQAENFKHASCSAYTGQVLYERGFLKEPVSSVLNPGTSVGLEANANLENRPSLPGVREDDLVLFIPSRVAPDKQFYNVRELVAGLQEGLTGEQRVNVVSAGPAATDKYLDFAFPKVDTPQLKTTYLGVLDRRGMERVYSRADCILMPNRAEAFGLATVEGMRYGLPVLGFNSGGTQEILSEFPDYPQYLIADKRGDMKIEPIISFLEHALASRERALNHQNLIMQRFNPQMLANQVLNFAQQVA